MLKIKSYVLPIAIVLGLLLHDYCAAFSVVVPYIIFTIILLTFTAVDITKLRFKHLDYPVSGSGESGWLLLAASL